MKLNNLLTGMNNGCNSLLTGEVSTLGYLDDLNRPNINNWKCQCVRVTLDLWSLVLVTGFSKKNFLVSTLWYTVFKWCKHLFMLFLILDTVHDGTYKDYIFSYVYVRATTFWIIIWNFLFLITNILHLMLKIVYISQYEILRLKANKYTSLVIVFFRNLLYQSTICQS